jgi:hypothetical protein
MPQKPDESTTFARLHEIADAIEQAEGPWRAAWNRISAPDATNTRELLIDLEKVENALNDTISNHVDEIAAVTGNSSSTLRSVYAPKKNEGGVWFVKSAIGMGPADFLRRVARHKSFNEVHWLASERKEEFDRLLEISKGTAPIVLDPATAAKEIVAGRTPHVATASVERKFGLSPLEKELLTLGALAFYTKSKEHFASTAVSATRDLGFVVVDFSGEEAVETFCHWPKGVAFNHISRQVVEVEPAHTVRSGPAP